MRGALPPVLRDGECGCPALAGGSLALDLWSDGGRRGRPAFSISPLRMKSSFAARLGARFDQQSLLAPSHPTQALQASALGLQRLRSWCEEGAGHDDRASTPSSQAFSSELTPALLPLSIVLVDSDAPDRARDTVLALALELDGSDALATCGSLSARWQFRLRVKARDVLPWCVRRRCDPWDCGYLPNSPSALTALHSFVPRGPTLMVAAGMTESALTLRLTILVARRQAFSLPVRLLVLDAEIGLESIQIDPLAPCTQIRLD